MGSNPRLEAPVLNARLRRAHISGGAVVANIGSPLDLTFPVQELGMGAKTLDALEAGTHPFCKTLKVRATQNSPHKGRHFERVHASVSVCTMQTLPRLPTLERSNRTPPHELCDVYECTYRPTSFAAEADVSFLGAHGMRQGG